MGGGALEESKPAFFGNEEGDCRFAWIGEKNVILRNVRFETEGPKTVENILGCPAIAGTAGMVGDRGEVAKILPQGVRLHGAQARILPRCLSVSLVVPKTDEVGSGRLEAFQRLGAYGLGRG
jgi:hypothetical protein